ncbi:MULTISPECIES: cytochrome c oxidase subunit II [Arthrobacter]|uniref:cytochrome-c oxidase n=1 Tax=Arthrobacter caoxuetaonis TaxID=2886935 RepID=A0A9X1MEL5_9MICC|nr:cytochrome c oxidase subunit II [Arthrobacter caoxuetaonis]MCC3282783.1 cytochrome c oxidase subunit II [Arthrobacter caoxuetaonis]MCC3297917.1 cytochrome c oxidase subunit II [Arthrobacter caoxuetaonis]MCC9193543.1 cytochrome c oxidase subunit II [Arthrobacter sp. zg-Y916]USQ55898.1 cytochrome c oxidase subunit II [Arthrobacter caoxuetaonis]
MSSQDRTSSRRARILKISAVTSAGALFLSGCSSDVQKGWLPTERDTTNHTGRIMDLWVNSWIAALAVGILTWGLILWCIIAYRRRKNETGYPRQLSYNLPLEIFYTAIPLFMVLVLFFFTDRDIRALDARVDDPDVIVDVRGKQWAWDFNYVKEDKYYSGVQVNLDGEEKSQDEFPTLYLPVNKSVELQLNARDVIHSFWVPAFLQKRDMIPGRTNYITLTPQQEGTFEGKCAELCGEYHSEMLFNVKVVSEAEYEAYVATLNDGQLGAEYDRNTNLNPTK